MDIQRSCKLLRRCNYTAHKWTTILHRKIWKCVPTKRNREVNDGGLKAPFQQVLIFAYAVRIVSMILISLPIFREGAHHPTPEWTHFTWYNKTVTSGAGSKLGRLTFM